MKRLALIPLLVLFLLMGVLVQGSLAYTAVTGCVIDGKTGQPWTHGGRVWVEHPAGSGINVYDDPNALDPTTGCFYAQAWPPGTHLDATVHILPNAGPLGQPDEILCQVPADTSTDVYDCGTMATNTGPNAVALVATEAVASNVNSTLWMAILFSLAGLVGAVALVRINRRRQAFYQ
jgi:hypothetical protein